MNQAVGPRGRNSTSTKATNAVRHALSVALASSSMLAACTSDASHDDAEPELGVFVPDECGSWNPPVAAPAGVLPAEAECEGEGCIVFTQIAEAAGLGTLQFTSTSPSDLDCVFDRTTISGATAPNEDCALQWFTGGVSVADIDNDGWPDLYMPRLAAPAHLFLNRADGTFADVAEAVGLGDCSWANGSVFGDIDNDGDLDLLVTTLGDTRYQLWLNQLTETGTLHFEEQAQARGFAMPSDRLHGGQSVTLGDFDRDGWLDAHVNEWLRTSHLPGESEPSAPAHGSRLLHNTGGGNFEDLTVESGVSLRGANPDGIFAYSSSFVDLDGDGWQDLAVAVDFGSSRLFWNESATGASTLYSDGTEAAGVNLENNAMGSTFADVDGDGALDWYVTAISEAGVCEWDEEPPCWTEVETGNRLYRYAGGRSFTDISEAAEVVEGEWSWGTVLFDADNDGDQDLALANGWLGRDSYGTLSHLDTATKLWLNDGNAGMSEQAEALGFIDPGQGRALVSFDYDRDGDLDLLVINHAGSPRLFRNDGGNRNPWLRVAVAGTTSNSDGRGAKVRVQIEADGPWQVREVGAASHFLGEGELIQHFGLGPSFDRDTGRIHRVEVEWPASGILQVFDEVEAGQTLEVIES